MLARPKIGKDYYLLLGSIINLEVSPLTKTRISSLRNSIESPLFHKFLYEKK